MCSIYVWMFLVQHTLLMTVYRWDPGSRKSNLLELDILEHGVQIIASCVH